MLALPLIDYNRLLHRLFSYEKWSNSQTKQHKKRKKTRQTRIPQNAIILIGFSRNLQTFQTCDVLTPQFIWAHCKPCS